MNGGRWNGLFFFASAVAFGVAVIVSIAAINDHLGRLLDQDLIAALAALVPFMVVGLVASIAGRRGIAVGVCAWLFGLASVLGLFLLGYLDYQQAIRDHAWTGAALSGAGAVCLAWPASLAGSLFGSWIGVMVARRGTDRGRDTGVETERS